jgi:hypothetical protein
MQTTTATEVKAALTIMAAVCVAIREAEQIPEGTLYAMMCGRVTMEGWQSMMRQILGTKLVERDASHMLRWVGPEIG